MLYRWQRESRKQRQKFVPRNSSCCKAGSGGKWRSCQHNCKGKIKRQETQTERIYSTSNNTKSVKASLIHRTLNLPLGCCQIHQLRASSRKAAQQVLVTRDNKTRSPSSFLLCLGICTESSGDSGHQRGF